MPLTAVPEKPRVIVMPSAAFVIGSLNVAVIVTDPPFSSKALLFGPKPPETLSMIVF